MAGATDGLFNFEGGCYAKMIKLSADAEPEIFATTQNVSERFMENVILDDEAGMPDFDDGSARRKTPAGAYPLHFIPNASDHRHASHIGQYRHHADRRRVRRAAADCPD